MARKKNKSLESSKSSKKYWVTSFNDLSILSISIWKKLGTFVTENILSWKDNFVKYLTLVFKLFSTLLFYILVVLIMSLIFYAYAVFMLLVILQLIGYKIFRFYANLFERLKN